MTTPIDSADVYPSCGINTILSPTSNTLPVTSFTSVSYVSVYYTLLTFCVNHFLLVLLVKRIYRYATVRWVLTPGLLTNNTIILHSTFVTQPHNHPLATDLSYYRSPLGFELG